MQYGSYVFVELVTRWKRNVAWVQKIAFCYLDGKGEGAPGIVIVIRTIFVSLIISNMGSF